MNLVGGVDKFEELKRFLLVDGLSMIYNFIVMFCSIKFALNKFNLFTVTCRLPWTSG